MSYNYLYIIHIILIAFVLIHDESLAVNDKTNFNINGAVLSHIHVEGSGYGSDKSFEMQKHIKFNN